MDFSRRALFAMSLGLACFATGAVAQGNSITGSYVAKGMNPSGSRYEGQVQILQDGTNVSVNWDVAGEKYSGAGLREGRVVVIDWGQPTPVVYVVMPSGELHGTWANGEGLERLIPQ